MHQLTMQALPAQPQSLSLATLVGASAQEHVPQLYLYVGLQNGVLIRNVVDESDGSLRDARKRFLGTRPVKLFQVTVLGRPAVLCLSSRSWLSYTHQGRYHMTPLSYELLEYSSAFSSEQCPEGVVAISGNTLRIVTVERLGELFNQTVIPLRYTPRKMLVHPDHKNILVLETDHNAYSFKVKKELQATLNMDDEDDEESDAEGKKTKKNAKKKAKKEGDEGDEGDEDSDEEKAKEEFIGSPQAGLNKWASCLRIVDPVQGETASILELEDNEAAFSCCAVKFYKDKAQADDAEWCLAVGTTRDYQISPPKCKAAFVHIYKWDSIGTSLTLLHKTEMEAPVLALCAYKGRLLVGVGNKLRIYDLGKRKLLRKAENKNFATGIQSIHVKGERIYVGDMVESFHFCKFNRKEKLLKIEADSLAPRYLTASCIVDVDSLAGGDKFGNIWISRLPAGVAEDIENDPSDGKALPKGQYGEILTTKPRKLEEIVRTHVGEVVTHIQKTSLVPGGAEALVYCTLMGGLGILLPFTNREDVEFFTHLEMHLRQEATPLCGRDHLAYKSYYFPVKDCIDGDLCEQFAALAPAEQQSVAEELACTAAEVNKKLEELRNRVL